MVCFILYRCNSDRVVSCIASIYSNCFTSCIFYVVTGNVYFVSCACITEVFTSFRCNFCDVFVARTSYVCFSLYFFSRSCSRFYVVNIYSIYSFCATICIFNNIASYLRSVFTFYYNSAVQFTFSFIGQVNSYVAARCSCFDVLAIVSTNYAKAQATSLVQFLKISSTCVTSQANCVIETVVNDLQLFFSSGATFFSKVRSIQSYVS